MKSILKQVEDLLKSETLNTSLAQPVLKEILEQIETQANLIEALKAEKESLLSSLEVSDLEVKELREALAHAATNLDKKTERIAEIERDEKQYTRQEIEIEFLNKQIDFMQRQSDMILRNAELKRTINSVVPIAVDGGGNCAGFVTTNHKTEEITETKE